MLYRSNMLRITENFENDNTVRLRLDGTVSETSFAEVEEAFTRHAENSREAIVVLDMAGVVFMNNAAAQKMVQLRGARIRFVNCSPFIETLLNTVEEGSLHVVGEFKS